MVSQRHMLVERDARLVRGDAAWKASMRAAAIVAAAESPWLSRQPEEVRNGLLGPSVLRRFGRGESIAGLDDLGSDLCFLFEGAVQAAIARVDGEVVPSHMISRLEWFGEYGAVGDRRNIAEFRATAPSLVLTIPHSALSRAMELPATRAAVIDLLLDALKTYVEMAGGLTGLRSEHRVRSKLHAMAGGAPATQEGGHVLRMSQDELAEVSCVSRSVVSKVMAQLIGEGVVQTGYRRIIVINRDGLMGPPDGLRMPAQLRLAPTGGPE